MADRYEYGAWSGRGRRERWAGGENRSFGGDRDERWNRGEDLGYASRGRGRQDYRQTRLPRGGAPYGDLELNAGGRGYEEFGAPHDDDFQPRHEFEPDYLHWREEQLRLHDRDYADWRANRREQYDEAYRRSRGRGAQRTPPRGFDDEPSRVKAVTDGWDTRRDADAFEARRWQR